MMDVVVTSSRKRKRSDGRYPSRPSTHQMVCCMIVGMISPMSALIVPQWVVGTAQQQRLQSSPLMVEPFVRWGQHSRYIRYYPQQQLLGDEQSSSASSTSALSLSSMAVSFPSSFPESNNNNDHCNNNNSPPRSHATTKSIPHPTTSTQKFHPNHRRSKSTNKNNKNHKLEGSTSRDEIRQLFRQAKILEKQGRWRKAVQIYQDILQNHDAHDAHTYLALGRLQAKRGINATTIFQTGTTACPNSVHLWQAWAVYEDTTSSLSSSSSLSMNATLTTTMSVGNTAIKSAPAPTNNATSASLAQQLFERALHLEPYNPYVCHAYGLMLLKRGNTALASQLWERALMKTSTAALVCSLGEVLIAQQKLYHRARDLYARNIVRLSSEREQIEVYLAWAWLEERYFANLDRAEELIETALALSPRSSVAQIALARLAGRRQQQQQHRFPGRSVKRGAVRDATVRRLASACLQIETCSSDTQPVDGRVYNAWANMEVKARRIHDARRILYRGLARYPQDHSLLQAAGNVEERLGNYTGARDLYSASLTIQPSAPTLVAYALLGLRQQERQSATFATTNFSDTKRLFEEALLIDKRHGPAYNAYGRAVYEHMQDEVEARKIFERGVRANCTDSASIYHGYARFELTLGNIDHARELLMRGNDEVRRMNVGTDSPHRDRGLFLTHTLGMLELNTNRPTISLNVFQEGIERYGNSSQLLLGAALCEVKLGNEIKARELFERSVLADERHAQAWQAWGVMEMRSGNLKTAKTLFECGIRSAPRHASLWHTYGVLENRLGNFEAARALFQKGVKVDPTNIALYQSWATLELRQCNYDTSKALIAKGLTLNKRNGSGWLIYAEIEERLGHLAMATLVLRRGIECCGSTTPNTASLYRAWGDLLVQQGQINKARDVLERGLEVDPNFAPLYHALAELEARIGNIDGLAKLNRRAASIFRANNTVEPTLPSSDIWGSKQRSRSSRNGSHRRGFNGNVDSGNNNAVPKNVAALAQRIVDDDEESNDDEQEGYDDGTVLDGLLHPTPFEETVLVGDLLGLRGDEEETSSSSNY